MEFLSMVGASLSFMAMEKLSHASLANEIGFAKDAKRNYGVNPIRVYAKPTFCI
jgi:hypothetical protein